MSFDAFENYSPGLQSPAVWIEDITPNDTTDLTRATRAINVAQSGVVRVITVDDVQGDIFVAAGLAFPIRVKRVLATGTTATGIRGLA